MSNIPSTPPSWHQPQSQDASGIAGYVSAGIVVLGLAIVFLIGQVTYPLVLGYFAPWDAPERDTLRVTAPAGEPYTVQLGSDGETFVDSLEEGEAYRDYPLSVSSPAYDSTGGAGSYEVAVFVGEDWPNDSWPEGDLGTILFVGGEHAACDGASGDGIGTTDIQHYVSQEPGGVMRVICQSYRY